MMRQMKYLIALCAALFLANCAQPEPEVIIQTEYVERNIPTVSRPDPVALVAPNFYVVNRDNFDDFIAEFRKKNATETFIAISVKDYENLSLGIADIKRYLEQQNEIIIYYETQVSK